MQASGHRFDPDRLHHRADDEARSIAAAHVGQRLTTRLGRGGDTLTIFPGMKRNGSPQQCGDRGRETPRFDIVNGFLKSMPWRYGFETTRIASAVREALRCRADRDGGSRRSRHIITTRMPMGFAPDSIR